MATPREAARLWRRCGEGWCNASEVDCRIIGTAWLVLGGCGGVRKPLAEGVDSAGSGLALLSLKIRRRLLLDTTMIRSAPILGVFAALGWLLIAGSQQTTAPTAQSSVAPGVAAETWVTSSAMANRGVVLEARQAQVPVMRDLRTLPAAPSLPDVPEPDPEAQAQDDLDKRAAKAAIERTATNGSTCWVKAPTARGGQPPTEVRQKFSSRWMAQAECLWTDIEKVRWFRLTCGHPSRG